MTEFVNIAVSAEIREHLRGEVARTGLPVWRVLQEQIAENEALRAEIVSLKRLLAEDVVKGEDSASVHVEPYRRPTGPVTGASRWLSPPPFPEDAA